MKETEQQIATSPELQMISLLSSNYSFDSRFDRMQSRMDELNKNQATMQHQLDKVSGNQEVMQTQLGNFQEQLRDIKIDMDRRFTESRADMLDRFSQVDKRFEQVDKRFEQVDKRFEQVDKRFEQVDKRFEQVDKRFEQVDKQLKNIVEKIDERFDKFDEKFNKIGDKFDEKFNKIGEKLDYRDDRQRKFTLRMFSIAISISSLSVLGVLVKILNFI
ncbi:MAG: hypothetical protein OMM_13146, partial [Candidatus Magnetoglobus multicellularis str. Araruama]